MSEPDDAPMAALDRPMPPRPSWLPEWRERQFWNMVELGEARECWPWRGSAQWDDAGRRSGLVKFDGRTYRPHRLLWELWVGPLNGRRLANQCGMRHCVNPAHWRIDGPGQRLPYRTRLTAREVRLIGLKP